MSIPAWFARGVFRMQEAAMHRPTFAMLAELERTQWLSRDGVEALQARRLNRLLAAALAHSPWHAGRLREAGLEAKIRAGSVALDDLACLPTMSKRDARENVDAMDTRQHADDFFRTCVPGAPPVCLLVDTSEDPPSVFVDPDRNSN